jgi:hypothetical protein
VLHPLSLSTDNLGGEREDEVAIAKTLGRERRGATVELATVIAAHCVLLNSAVGEEGEKDETFRSVDTS